VAFININIASSAGGRVMDIVERLRAALAPVAALKLWRDTYPDAARDTLVDGNLASYFTPDQVRRARELIADRVEAADVIERLRKGIQDYLDGDYEPKIRKMDKCQHGLYGYEHCENCSDEHFARVLADGQLERDGE
jgi:hypothetical protein